jgi:Asp-tRNA(Asn)/Glu-tRNA(Gln) amidotransferase C subunit
MTDTELDQFTKLLQEIVDYHEQQAQVLEKRIKFIDYQLEQLRKEK